MDVWNQAKNLALRSAFEIRKRLSIARESPVNVFDICDRIGVDVRFLDCKSLEGMYFRGERRVILLPTTQHRPRARIAFSCAHELGHDQLGHGTKADKYLAEGNRKRDPEEYAADLFAAHLLMPRQAVIAAFKRRRWPTQAPSDHQVYHVAGELGVGYSSLVFQLNAGLRMIDETDANALRKSSPKLIRSRVLEDSRSTSLLLLDECWSAPSADTEVGGFIRTPADWIPSSLFEQVSNDDRSAFWRANASGNTVFSTSSGRRVTARVSRSHYVGTYRNCFREDED